MLFRGPSLLPINVGSGKDLSILELAQEVVAVLNPAHTICVARKCAPDAEIARYVPSVERAREYLGLEQTVTLRESIRRTAAWYRNASEDI
jgi:dTDP-glucose 4,6-dehydratase